MKSTSTNAYEMFSSYHNVMIAKYRIDVSTSEFK